MRGDEMEVKRGLLFWRSRRRQFRIKRRRRRKWALGKATLHYREETMGPDCVGLMCGGGNVYILPFSSSDFLAVCTSKISGPPSRSSWAVSLPAHALTHPMAQCFQVPTVAPSRFSCSRPNGDNFAASQAGMGGRKVVGLHFFGQPSMIQVP